LRTIHVYVEDLIRISHIVLHAHDRGKVIHEVGPGDKPLEDLAVQDGVADVAESGIAELVAYFEIRGDVENTNFVASLKESIAQMRTKETRPTRDQYPHLIVPQPVNSK